MKPGTKVRISPAVMSEGTLYCIGFVLTNTQEGVVISGNRNESTVKWDNGVLATNLPDSILEIMRVK